MKRRVWTGLREILFSYLVVFVLCSFVVTCSFLLFFHSVELDPEQVRAAAPYTFGNILLLTGIFVTLDVVRRRIMVDRPVEQINSALRQITGGNFQVQLDPAGVSPNFVEIMESINHMTRELSGVETLRSDFIANVSHEMKTPLTVMHNYGTLLQTPGLSEEKRLEYARSITRSSRDLSELMTNILKLNRLENQQIFPQVQAYDLSEQLCQSLLQYETIWEREGIGLEADIQESVTIRADGELLGLVWNNLFSNAFKFTDRGGTVRVTLTADDTWVVVAVEDTGCGMSPETGAHIFEKFYQGDTSRAVKGNGLGLPLVRRIMDITGGEITVRSTLGVGSVFTVRLRRDYNGAR